MLDWLSAVDRVSLALEKYVTAPLRLDLWKRGFLRDLSDRAAHWTDPGNLGLEPAARARLDADIAATGSHGYVVVADVDQDGLLQSAYGHVAHRTCIGKDEFMSRRRTDVRIIASRRGVAVEKFFRGNRVGFVRELDCLVRLRAAGCRVPRVFEADAKLLTLRTEYIAGGVLRDLLVAQGARLLDRQQPGRGSDNPALDRLRRVREGRRYLSSVAGASFRDELLVQIKRAHAAGVALSDVKFGNIILGVGRREPWLIDFERSRYFAFRRNPVFARLCAEDLERVGEMLDAAQPSAPAPRVEVLT